MPNPTPAYTAQDLTCFAMGELDPQCDAHRAIAAALKQDPAIRAEIDAIKASAAAVHDALAHEPVPASTSRDRQGADKPTCLTQPQGPLPHGRGSSAPLFARPALLAAGFALAAGAAIAVVNLVQPNPGSLGPGAHLTPHADAPRGLANIHTALQTPITASFQNAPLADVFSAVQRETHTDLAVDWPALEARGIARDTKVTFDADGLPARDLLSLALAACWQQLPHPDPAVWTVTQTQVRIEPRSATVQRAFDQAQVVLAAHNTTNAHLTQSQLALANHPGWQQPGAVTEVIQEQRRAAAQQQAEQELAQARARQQALDAARNHPDLLAEARLQLAQDKADEAMDALANQQPALATQLLEEALLLDPDGARSHQLSAMLAEARAQASNELRPNDPLTDRAQNITIVRQETAARYEQAMTRAVEALNRKEYDAGMDAIVEARTVLNANRSTFSNAERNELVARAARLQTSINDTRTMDEANRIRQAEMDQSHFEAEARGVAEQRRNEQVQQRLRNARELQMNRDYAGALVELEAAQFIDPNNRAVEALRGIVQDVTIGTEAIRLRRELDLMRSNQQIINGEVTIPYDELLTYPGDWPELTQMRLQGLTGRVQRADSDFNLDYPESLGVRGGVTLDPLVDRSASATRVNSDPAFLGGGQRFTFFSAEADQTALLALRKLVSADLGAQPLGRMIDFLRDSTGANIAVDWPTLERHGISRETHISVTLDQVPADQLLTLVLEQASAGLEGDAKAGFAVVGGITQISTLSDLSAEAAAVQRRELLHRLQSADAALEPQLSRDTYALVNDNPFHTGFNDPLSTFSVDVDTAAYALVRRQVMQQNQPPVPGAVRIEELVNYFDYSYAAPVVEPEFLDDGVVTQASLERLAEGDDSFAPFATHVEVTDCPWAQGHQLVRIGVKGMEVEQDDRPAAHLTFLLDVSGSMRADNKLPLVVESLKMLLTQLNADDHVSIVVYAGAAGVVLEHAAAGDPATIEAALNQLRAGGSTAGGEGIQLAYDIAQRHFVDGGVNRVILCTDGDFNVGISDRAALVELIKQRANPEPDDNGQTRGVYLSVLGFGSGNLNDAMIEPLTNAGNGNYAYIDSAAEAHKVMVEQVGGTLVAIAKDVKIQVEFNPTRVLAYRLIGYENRILAHEDFENDTVDAGDIGAGHTVTALYEVVPFPGDGLDDTDTLREVKRQIEALDEALAFSTSVLENTPLTDEQYRKLMGSVAMLQQQRAVAFALEETVKHRPASADIGEGPAGIDLRYRRGVEIVDDVDELMVVNLRYKPVDAPAEQGTSRLIQTLVAPDALPFGEASEDTRFAAAVAGYGMVLRHSPHRGDADFAWVLDTAGDALGDDTNGYRAGFVALVERSAELLPDDAERDQNVIAPH